jgi:LemA protein
MPAAVPLIIMATLLVGLALYAVNIFNGLVQVRNNVDKAFKNIDVLLQQRHDELPKLVDACRGYMKYEKELLDGIVRLREQYGRADTADEKTGVENQIGRQMVALAAKWEAYPDLKASQSFLAVQERISTLESGIADRREFFNDSVNIYNIQIERFPQVVLARILGYARRAFLEVPEEKKGDVKVDLS